MAPEVIDFDHFGPKADVFSYGILVWEMYAEDMPFTDNNNKILRADLIKEAIKSEKRPTFYYSIDNNLRNLITACWSHLPSSRIDFLEVRRRMIDLNILYVI